MGDVIDVISFIDLATTPRPSRTLHDRPRFGAYRAQWSVLEALGGLRSRIHLTVVTTPTGEHELRREAGEWCDVVSYPDIGRLRPRPCRTVVHHVGQAFELVPYRLRRLMGIYAPVTSGHHSLGYTHLVDAARRLDQERAHPGDALIASSEHGRRVLGNIIGHASPNWLGRIEVVPLPVNVRPPTPGERRTARAALGLGPDTVLILSIGRLSRHDKATLEPLLWAVAELQAEGDQAAQVVIAGEDRHRYAVELRRQADLYGTGDRVRVLPSVSEDQRLCLLRAADIFVGLYDSRQEVFGLAVAEAQAAGLPGVVSDYSNPGDVVEDGVTGVTVPTTEVRAQQLHETWEDLLPWQEEHLLSAQLVAVDRDALLRALRHLVSDPEHRRRMGTAAAHAARRYRPSTVANEFVDCWEGCLDRVTRAPAADEALGRAWSTSDVFEAFSTRTVLPAEALWQPRHAVPVTDLIDEDLRRVVGGDALLRAAQVLRRTAAPVRMPDLARAAGQPPEMAMLAIAVLHKYGYVTYCGSLDERPRAVGRYL